MTQHNVVSRSRRASAAVVMALLAVLGLLAPPAAAAARDEPALRLNVVPTAVKGARTTLAIQWVHEGKPVTGTVNLERRIGSGAWTHLRTVPVTAGAGSTVLAPAQTASYRLRAQTASEPAGTPVGHPAGTSAVVPMSVSTVVNRGSAPVLSGPVMRGGDGAARLRIDWTRSGVPITGQVALQRDTGSGFKHIRYVTVRDGSAVTAITVPTTAVFRLRIASNQGGAITRAHPYGSSNEHRVSVPPTTTTRTPSSFELTGGGWGHGVGMSQYGAYGMAREGSSRNQILNHFFTDVSVYQAPASADDQDVLVQVSKPRSSTTVRANGGPMRVRIGGAVKGEAAAGQSITLSPSGTGGVAVAFPDGSKAWTSSASSPVQVEWASTRYYPGSGAVYVSIGGSHGTYRHGRLHFTRIDGKVNGSVSVRFSDEYMYGIAEVPSSWPPAALQAQAVAARSYALFSMPRGLRSDCDCHLYDSVRSQNYTGWKKENEATYGVRWKKAVDDTMSGGRGLVLFERGTTRVAQAFYFSSSGGRTENSEDVWSAALPYTRSVADPWSRDASINPNASWTATVSQSTARSAFGLSDVQSLQVVATTQGGAVTLRATSKSGATKTLQGEKVRTALGLKSAWVRSITPKY